MGLFAEITSGVVTNIAVANATANLPAGTWAQIDSLSPQPGIGWPATETNGVWTFTAPAAPAPTLAQAQAAQSAAMQMACQGKIVAGFTSSALGAANSYPSDQVTQTNVTLAASVGGGSLWCQPSGGAWVLTAHTAAEAQQVQKDLTAHIQTQQTTYAGLLTQIAEATTVAAVPAVAWP